ncbi:G-type lectin S-receptor-like serine/threonine-protein kinase At4g03230 [Arachis stenosperma]|uniref:G-type lectin S-receptor-like serine/threonine-protein kinase At4g03230 n=1 Tax=Arachis stenosperma TaxID=217475 RepID=UPI0025AD6D20|nr:G-type lectin S-receptor-like serine/threonine-protein kinase At4g03230 [Arachis stenosperma]
MVDTKRFCSNRMLFFFLLCSFFCTCMHCYGRDTITINNFLLDGGGGGGGDTLISDGENFELGFFTPNGSSSGRRRYIGIWYYNLSPRTVVWVANRDTPLEDSGGAFGISEDGNLRVLDRNGRPFWGTSLETSSNSSLHRTLKLMDNGNLIVIDEQDGEETKKTKILWESFANPTDTFLPGMKMYQGLSLTSWRSNVDPSPGNYSFQRDQEDSNNNNDQYMIWKRSIRYWKSSVTGKVVGTGEMSLAISYFLSNFTEKISENYNNTVPFLTSSLYSNTRLVITYWGQLLYLKMDSEKTWSNVWVEPRDRCSVFNACGNFGSCNSKYHAMCKCLPGFRPNSHETWDAGDFSRGCSRKTNVCGEDAKSDTFLRLKMMKVGNPDAQFKAKSEEECKAECLNNCQCYAYSYEDDQTGGSEGGSGRSSGDAVCWIWSEDLNNLEEDYENGCDLNVRVALSDIESTGKSCGTCGTNLIAYPLSRGANCGDPMYLSFHCNDSTGQLDFETPGSAFRVISIDQDKRKFVIHIEDVENCEDQTSWDNKKLLLLNDSSPFHLTGTCYADPRTFTSAAPMKHGVELELSWDPPSEPLCSTLLDCMDWPNSSCNTTSDGNKRCLCNTNYFWDGMKLNCTNGNQSYQADRNLSLTQIMEITFTIVIAIILLSSTVIYIYLKKRRHANSHEIRGYTQKNPGLSSEKYVRDLIESGRFKEENSQAIDIPHFHLESVLDATNNFAIANKLGQGGFGPVYKGKFPGGQEIAVKRLSSCSGQGLEEFKNEVVLIAKLQHRNLVRLLGYCLEGDEKMLIYEYMPNRSLDGFIFDRKLCVLLDWDVRFKIILGIARGLLYLHEDSRLRIIHRDLKTSNILLDEEKNPKISDFGLARIFGGKETVANTDRVVGTYGYMSPEYALDGHFSVKSDVFSFGVVVLEIISGKRNTGFYQAEHELSLLGFAWHLWKVGRALDFMDQTLCETCNADECLKCVNVGLLCLQEDPNERPNMSNVVFMLGSESNTLPSPKEPAFVMRRCPSSRASTSSKLETFSRNDLTVTLENGR